MITAAYLVAHLFDSEKGDLKYDLATTIKLPDHTDEEIMNMSRTMGEAFGKLLIRAKEGKL